MSDNLIYSLTRTKQALEVLANIAKYQSDTVAQYVTEAMYKIEAARQQVEAERQGRVYRGLEHGH